MERMSIGRLFHAERSRTDLESRAWDEQMVHYLPIAEQCPARDVSILRL